METIAMKGLHAILLITVIVCATVFVGTFQLNKAQTGTEVFGEISSDTIWDAVHSPYNLSSDLTIKSGITLTIEAGATINTYNKYIQVDGTLNAKGKTGNPVVFVSANQHIYPFYPSYPDANIHFSENSSGLLENAILNSTQIYSQSSITLLNSTITCAMLTLDNSYIANSVITGSLNIGGSSVVTNNTIIAGRDYYTAGIVSNYGSPTISGNIIKSMPNNTLVWGIIFGGNDYSVISDNVISNCDQVGILVGEVNSGTSIIERNLITNNLFPHIVGEDMGGVGIEVIGTNTTALNLIIRNNTITQNTVGINIHAPLLDKVNRTIQPTILNNNVFNNTRNNIYLGRPIQNGQTLGAGGNINAIYNWWGTTDIQSINQSIYDFKNDSVLGVASFVPFLSSPNLEAYPNPNRSLPTPTIIPSIAPTNSTTQTPTLEPSPTPNNAEDNFAPIAVAAGLLIAVTVVIALLVYFKKRRG